MFSSIDSHQKCQKHEEHCNTQLSMELAGISFADFSEEKKEIYWFLVNAEVSVTHNYCFSYHIAMNVGHNQWKYNG